MTRAVLLTTDALFATIWLTIAVINLLGGDYLWLAIALIGLGQSCESIQLLAHGARLDRHDDVIGAWRRQDPEAWRRS